MSPNTGCNADCWLSGSQWLTPSRCRSPRPQAPLGPLNDYHVRLLLFPQQLQQGRHWTPILKDSWIRCSLHSAEEALKSKQKIQLQLESDIMISWELTAWNRRMKTAAYRILIHWPHCMSPWISLVHHSRREVTSLWDTVCSSLVHLVLWTFKLS